MNIPPLECAGVHKRHGTQAVLRGVDLRLPEGAVVGLVGRNGAGKSTLIRVLLGLDAPDAGAARVFGRPAAALGDDALRQLGYVPQEASAFGWMRVGEMLDLVGHGYPAWDAAFVDAQLARWHLDRRQLLARLSPGERQRVAIVRALAPNPRLLVLDEPAAALDPVARRDLLREIAGRAGDSGTTVLFSTHIVSDLERVASHVAFLHEGRIALMAELDDLKERHTRLVVPAALAPAAATPLPGELRRRPRPDGSMAITLVRDEGAPWPALAGEAGVRHDTLALEDLFIEVSA